MSSRALTVAAVILGWVVFVFAAQLAIGTFVALWLEIALVPVWWCLGIPVGIWTAKYLDGGR